MRVDDALVSVVEGLRAAGCCCDDLPWEVSTTKTESRLKRWSDASSAGRLSKISDDEERSHAVRYYTWAYNSATTARKG